MNESARIVILRVPPLWGIDLSITHGVLMLWVAAALTLLLLIPACRRRGPIPRGTLQNLFEAMVSYVEREVVTEGIGAEGRLWAPFLLATFFFILFGNLLGLVPVPGLFGSATANINVTAALATVVFALTVWIGIRRHGPGGFLRRFMPADVPWWLGFLIVPIEIVSWLAKPFSLAIRLFANMLAGHALVFVFIGLAAAGAWLLKWIPLFGAVMMMLFEAFGSVIQAFIFTMLAGIYIKEALEEPH